MCTNYFDTYRIQGNTWCREQTIKQLHFWSDDWPSHMRNALKGLSVELLQTKGNLQETNIKKGLELARTYRENYYAKGKGTFFNKSIPFLGLFLTDPPTGTSIAAHKIGEHILNVQKKAALLGDRKIAEQPAEVILNHLLHQGFIQPDMQDNYTCPIPSL